MWVPSRFREDDRETLHDWIEANDFALLVSADAQGVPTATHLPFLLDRDRGPHGTLIAHMARANPHWRSLGGEALVVFSGAHAYISPSWYEDQVTVPTWNYVAVHAVGRPVLVEERDALLEMVGRLTRRHESRVGSPWTLERAAPVLESELRGIVGFEIGITRLEGKRKLNQNRSAADQRGVIRALRASSDPQERAIARMMAERLGEKGAGAG